MQPINVRSVDSNPKNPNQITSDTYSTSDILNYSGHGLIISTEGI